ncbi:peptide chain release factor N(5)-glutamine methyltransferase [Virgibacillus doumboii]|uniref:peptide chain release factor N(5)-glutamine methyltransferase n=1 Tax=Virgibacillus doumboii TaxID=2697503 RepID=UPI0013DEDCF8|nr:peptide chain release factor N(5)-glutamine methyltransferase [Virgibacillus doumboii]
MEKESKIYEVLRWASLFLEKNNRETRVAELLLQHYLGVFKTEFITMMRDPVPENIHKQFQRAIEKHAETGVPIQHIIGHETFYGRTFHVNEHTLIPRPETEELVQQVIEAAPDKPLTIIDIGTGSGIIAITIALELPNATVYATDISEEALAIAQKNAKKLNAEVTFLQGDFLKPFIDEGKLADIIVSNPPYIARSEAASLSDTVKNFDPELALFAEANGLAAYKNIITDLPQAITDEAQVFFEIGHDQGKAVSGMLYSKFPSASIEIIKDINKKNRIVKTYIKN